MTSALGFKVLVFLLPGMHYWGPVLLGLEPGIECVHYDGLNTLPDLDTGTDLDSCPKQK